MAIADVPQIAHVCDGHCFICSAATPIPISDHDSMSITRRARQQWEDAVLSLEPNVRPGLFSAQDDLDMCAFVRICTHYLQIGHGLKRERSSATRTCLQISPASSFTGGTT
ncbi:MAG: hypothetical protein KA712_14180 [Myxococcales bacterium]|nr:hypothetical protein [Myxococcales bacterium]